MVDEEGRRKEYDIAASDKLWSNFKGQPFPLVAEAIQEGLDTCRKNEEEIKQVCARAAQIELFLRRKTQSRRCS